VGKVEQPSALPTEHKYIGYIDFMTEDFKHSLLRESTTILVIVIICSTVITVVHMMAPYCVAK
jgi:hypothetical protein